MMLTLSAGGETTMFVWSLCFVYEALTMCRPTMHPQGHLVQIWQHLLVVKLVTAPS
jgi:hypothetical protein